MISLNEVERSLEGLLLVISLNEVERSLEGLLLVISLNEVERSLEGLLLVISLNHLRGQGCSSQSYLVISTKSQSIELKISPNIN